MRERIAEIDRQIGTSTARIRDLMEMAGQGTDEDRAEVKAQLRAAQHRRATLQADKARCQAELAGGRNLITPVRVRQRLSELTEFLTVSDADSEDEERAHRAAAAFELLVGGRIDVHIERRPGRKRSNVRGSFIPQLHRGLSRDPQLTACEPTAAVDVWLREHPRKDLLSGPVHQLIDEEGHSFRSATDLLVSQGHRLNSGVVWQIHQRYWEMRGEPAPKTAYNSGRPRRARCSKI